MRITVATQSRDNTTLFVQWEVSNTFHFQLFQSIPVHKLFPPPLLPQPPLEEERNGIITAYTIQYRINRTDNLLRREVTGNTTRIILDRLVPGQRYAVQIAAHTAAGMGPFSEPHYADTITSESSSTISLLHFLLLHFLLLLLHLTVSPLTPTAAPTQPQLPFFRTVWFIFMCVAVVVAAVLLLGCLVVIVKWKKNRKSGTYPGEITPRLQGTATNLSNLLHSLSPFLPLFPSPSYSTTQLLWRRQH